MSADILKGLEDEGERIAKASHQTIKTIVDLDLPFGDKDRQALEHQATRDIVFQAGYEYALRICREALKKVKR